MKYAIIDFRASDETIKTLKKHIKKIIFTHPKNTYESICGHPDISVCKIDNKTIVVSPDDYDYYKKQMPDINVISGELSPGKAYPDDVLYNSACTEAVAIHNFKFTDKITLAVIEQKFLKRIQVNQGYSKCSICVINNKSMITDDEGIHKKLIESDLDSLYINKGDVTLSGMNYGFFGGATGTYKDKLFLNGEISLHTDSEKIKQFLNKHDTELIELKKGFIEDIGSIIIL